MIEYIKHKNQELSMIIRTSFSKDGIEFFTPKDYPQQVGYMKRIKGYIIKPHIHYQIPAMKRLNNRPRKRLGFKTPNQVFFEESHNVALTT
jgi:hypothetical protein